VKAKIISANKNKQINKKAQKTTTKTHKNSTGVLEFEKMGGKLYL
jgi:hypothetical protein